MLLAFLHLNLIYTLSVAKSLIRGAVSRDYASSMTKKRKADVYVFGGEEDNQDALIAVGKQLLSPPKGKDALLGLLKVRTCPILPSGWLSASKRRDSQ